jgi:hypothetical protein
LNERPRRQLRKVRRPKSPPFALSDDSVRNETFYSQVGVSLNPIATIPAWPMRRSAPLPVTLTTTVTCSPQNIRSPTFGSAWRIIEVLSSPFLNRQRTQTRCSERALGRAAGSGNRGNTRDVTQKCPIVRENCRSAGSRPTVGRRLESKGFLVDFDSCSPFLRW